MAKNDKRTITREEALGWNPDPVPPALEEEGITPSYIAKKLKRELNAKEIKAQIPKGEKEFVYSKLIVAWDIRQKGPAGRGAILRLGTQAKV